MFARLENHFSSRNITLKTLGTQLAILDNVYVQGILAYKVIDTHAQFQYEPHIVNEAHTLDRWHFIAGVVSSPSY